jgi:CheY-like chemotaxis protein
MPKMDGFRLTQGIRSVERIFHERMREKSISQQYKTMQKAKIIIVTAQREESFLKRSQEAIGYDALVFKPLTCIFVAEAIRDYILNSARLGDEQISRLEESKKESRRIFEDLEK